MYKDIFDNNSKLCFQLFKNINHLVVLSSFSTYAFSFSFFSSLSFLRSVVIFYNFKFEMIFRSDWCLVILVFLMLSLRSM